MSRNWRQVRWLICVALLSYGFLAARAEEPNLVARMKELGLATLTGKIPAYYSTGHREHAQNSRP